MSEERAEYGAEEALPEEAAAVSLVGDLESAYDDPCAEWTLSLSKGHTVRVRVVHDVSEKIRLESKAEAVVKTARKVPLPAWKPFLPAEPAVVQSAYMMAELLIDPQIDFVKALEWAKHRGGLFMEIAQAIAARLNPQYTGAAVEAVEEAGED